MHAEKHACTCPADGINIKLCATGCVDRICHTIELYSQHYMD